MAQAKNAGKVRTKTENIPGAEPFVSPILRPSHTRQQASPHWRSLRTRALPSNLVQVCPCNLVCKPLLVGLLHHSWHHLIQASLPPVTLLRPVVWEGPYSSCAALFHREIQLLELEIEMLAPHQQSRIQLHATLCMRAGNSFDRPFVHTY
jgi:hypothetical protein